MNRITTTSSSDGWEGFITREEMISSLKRLKEESKLETSINGAFGEVVKFNDLLSPKEKQAFENNFDGDRDGAILTKLYRSLPEQYKVYDGIHSHNLLSKGGSFRLQDVSDTGKFTLLEETTERYATKAKEIMKHKNRLEGAFANKSKRQFSQEIEKGMGAVKQFHAIDETKEKLFRKKPDIRELKNQFITQKIKEGNTIELITLFLLGGHYINISDHLKENIEENYIDYLYLYGLYQDKIDEFKTSSYIRNLTASGLLLESAEQYEKKISPLSSRGEISPIPKYKEKVIQKLMKQSTMLQNRKKII